MHAGNRVPRTLMWSHREKGKPMTNKCSICGATATIDDGSACAQCGCDREADGGWLARIVQRLRGWWAEITHRHEWVRTNDASMDDVPGEYPPSRVCYASPKRKCLKCGAGEWDVGPEVCGGPRARWVPALIDYSPLNVERTHGARKEGL